MPASSLRSWSRDHLRLLAGKLNGLGATLGKLPPVVIFACPGAGTKGLAAKGGPTPISSAGNVQAQDLNDIFLNIRRSETSNTLYMCTYRRPCLYYAGQSSLC